MITRSCGFMAAFLAAVILAPNADAVTKVARKYHVLEFHASHARPWGTYGQLGSIPFLSDMGVPTTLEADELFDPTFSLGLTYGQLYREHWLVTFGFRFTNINVDDQIVFTPIDIDFRQFDLDLNVNYQPFNILTKGWSPYLGVGMSAGLLVTDAEGFASENDATVAFNLNFGADLKLTSTARGGSFVTLSSANSWNFYGANDRPKYLHIGGAIKYWFRP